MQLFFQLVVPYKDMGKNISSKTTLNMNLTWTLHNAWGELDDFDIDGVVQDYSFSNALAMEIL